MNDLTVYMTHAEYERRDPGAAAYAKSIEDSRRRRDGDDFKPMRQFPCPGTLRLDGPQIAKAKLYCCDVCGEEVGVPIHMARGEATGAWLLERSNLPEHHRRVKLEATLGNNDALVMLRQWSKAQSGGDGVPAPMLIGEVGRGKTQLLASVAVEHMNETGQPITYWAMADLLKAEQQTFKTGDKSPVEEAKAVRILILDDLGAERESAFASDMLGQIIDARYRAGLPTLGATNIEPGEWADVFGDRTADRLLECCAAVRVTGESRRINA